MAPKNKSAGDNYYRYEIPHNASNIQISWQDNDQRRIVMPLGPQQPATPVTWLPPPVVQQASAIGCTPINQQPSQTIHHAQYPVQGSSYVEPSPPSLGVQHDQRNQISQAPFSNVLPPSAHGHCGLIADVTSHHLLVAAFKFNRAARRCNVEYAIIGGVSSHIFANDRRQTNSLDILLAPRLSGRQFHDVTPVIDELFNRNVNDLNFVLPNRMGHIVVTEGTSGIRFNFIDCVNNSLDFPDLVAMTRPDGTQGNEDGRAPTYSFQHINPPGVDGGIYVPVVLPRILLQQRLLHFHRSRPERDKVSRQKNDVQDIIAYLNVLSSVENESFTLEEAQVLVPKVRDVLHFARLHWLPEVLDLAKWRWINIEWQYREGEGY